MNTEKDPSKTLMNTGKDDPRTGTIIFIPPLSVPH